MPRSRANNEGSIYRRPDGRWTARVSLPNGSRHDFYGKTRGEVGHKLNDALKALRDGVSLPSGRFTVASFAKHWLGGIQSNVRPKTFECYETALRVHVLPRLGSLPLRSLTAASLQQLYSDLTAASLSPKSTRNVHAVVHAMLARAMRLDLVARNVADLADAPRVPPRKLDVFDSTQARSFLTACRGHRLEALFTLAITAGARSGELLGLTWDCVDLDTGAIHIRRSLQEMDGKFSLVEPKTARSRRTVAIPLLAVEALRRHRVHQLEESMLAGADWRNDWNLVFTTQFGTPIDRHNVLRRDLRPLLAAASLPRLRFHDLRHIAISLLLGQGMPIPVVSEFAGHSDAATTLRVYAHAVPGSQRQTAAVMQAALAG